jgi:hypothetical protein
MKLEDLLPYWTFSMSVNVNFTVYLQLETHPDNFVFPKFTTFRRTQQNQSARGGSIFEDSHCIDGSL